MKSKRATKKPRGWFYPVRGSYLPSNWQAWTLYLVASLYILAPLIVAVKNRENAVYTSAHFVSRILLAGIVLTWIAQKKS